VKQLENQNP